MKGCKMCLIDSSSVDGRSIDVNRKQKVYETDIANGRIKK